MSKPPYDVIPAKAGIQKLLRSGVETPVGPQEQFFVWPHLPPKKMDPLRPLRWESYFVPERIHSIILVDELR
jgi:hypothetical protein